MFWRMTELSNAAFRSSYQPKKELLNISDAGINVSNTTGKVVQLCLHAIEATFDR